MTIKAAGYTADAQTDGTFTGITNPSSFHRSDITFTCRIINNRYWTHTITHTISHATSVSQNTDAITDGAVTEVNVGTMIALAKNVPIQVTFTTTNPIPSSGTIYLYFQTTMLLPKDNCRSVLYDTGGNPSTLVHGALTQINCQVVELAGRKGWSITGFETLSSAANYIKI